MRISIGSAFGSFALAPLFRMIISFVNFSVPSSKAGGYPWEHPRYDYFTLGVLPLCNNAQMAGNQDVAT
jgi:hypothetical protein